MCGNWFSNPVKTAEKKVQQIAHDPWSTIGTIAGSILGGPLGAAAGNFAGDVASQGPSKAFGKNLGSNLIGSAGSGIGSYLTSNLAGGLSDAFPETAGAISDAIPPASSLNPFSSITDGIGNFLSGVGDTVKSGVNSAESILGINPSFSTGAPAPSAPSVAATGGGVAPASVLGDVNPADPWNFKLSESGGAVSPATGYANFDINGNVPSVVAPVSNVASNLPKSTFGTVTDFLKNNASAILPAASLGISALKQNKPLPGEGATKDIAANLKSQGADLQKYLASGTLPPGAQQGLNQASEAAKAQIRSRHAQQGTSGSSAEQEELAAVDSHVQEQGFNMAMNLLSQGVNETGLAAGLYQNIMNSAIQQDQQLGSAFANFGTALAGGKQPTAAA